MDAEIIPGAVPIEPIAGTIGTLIEPSAELNRLRSRLRRNGYMPVPVRGKRPTMRDWVQNCQLADDAEIGAWSKRYPDCTNTGLLTGQLLAIDIDVLDERLVKKIENLIPKHLGPTPLKRVGKAPKSMLFFRTENAFKKRKTPDFIGPDDSKHCVEVLGDGQQCVAFGLHPETQKAYTWPNKSPLDVKFSELPVVTEAIVMDLLNEIELLLNASYLDTKKEVKRRETTGGHAGRNNCVAPTKDIVRDALKFYRNDDLSYDDWIRIGFVLYSAFGDEGRDIWEDWSAESSKNDPEETAKKWPSFATVRGITIKTLYYHAFQGGWQQRDGEPRIANPNSSDARPVSGLPEIRVVAGELPRAVDQAEEALIASGPELYQRGGAVVRVANMPIKVVGGLPIVARRIILVDNPYMRECMNRSAQFLRYDKKARDWLITDCPGDISTTYLSRKGNWRIPVLTGITNCPTLRRDGSLLGSPGYDRQTGLLFDPEGCEFQLGETAPSLEEALAAMSHLLSLISTFKFVSDADRSVALSGILSALIRISVDAVPMHAFTAPVAGSGKSMLVDIISIIVSGQRAAVMSQGQDDEEMEKRLGASFLAGDPLITIDNCEQPLGGQLLCQALTQTRVKIRVLGKSEQMELPTTACVFATGNNLTLAGDMTRHALLCSLDTGQDRPELIEYDTNPLDDALAYRAVYVAAGLTILRAYHNAGRPNRPSALGSFEQWSDWIRGAIIWLGLADPCETMERVRRDDPKRHELRGILVRWGNSAIAVEPVSVSQLIHIAARDVEFFDTLRGIAPDGQNISSVRPDG
jgi:putative DNA primase/helicase